MKKISVCACHSAALSVWREAQNFTTTLLYSIVYIIVKLSKIENKAISAKIDFLYQLAFSRGHCRGPN